MIFCVQSLHIYVNLTFNNSVSFLREQQNVDAKALQNAKSHCEIHTMLHVLCDQACCRMRHKRTGIRISLSHLSILYPVHLLTFHVIQFLHILTSLCRGTQKDDLFVHAYTNKTAAPPVPLVHTLNTPDCSFFTYK